MSVAAAYVAPEALPWAERNKRWMVARLAQLRSRVENPEGRGELPLEDEDEGFASALRVCAEIFGLSAFERDLLLLCAGVALDGGLARAVSAAAGAPTFSLGLSVLDEPHWDALSPQAPLRYWRLVALDGPAVPQTPLRIDERVMHYLTGVDAFDERLDGYAELVQPPEAPQTSSSWVSQVVSAFASGEGSVQLSQPGGHVLRDQVLELLSAIRRPAVWISRLPEDAGLLTQTLRLVDREASLASALVVLDLRDATEGGGSGALTRARALAQLHTPTVVLDASDTAHPDDRIRSVLLPERTPAAQADELAARARQFGSPLALGVLRDAIADSCEQFVLNQPRAFDEVAQKLAEVGDDVGAVTERSWSALRACSRGGLDQLAQRIESDTEFSDLVLPSAQRVLLQTIGRQLMHRRRVYRDWGFAGRGARGLGLAALFSGESGTGKTMAAEAIAHSARLDLYRIDLASTVSKYIGETEKNLKRIFDAAEVSGAVLLFDEADALFGKRSEVKDSHDRYANIETAYLLQRIEAYRGLAILTTNMKASLDRAFMRRIRFVVQFPFPDDGARTELWRRQFPPQAPLHEDIDWDTLARLHLTGGHIRSVALNAAFAAAHDGRAISQAHLMAAAHVELLKLERTPGLQPGGRS